MSKILQMMEKGTALQFKNKSLEEIDIDMEDLDDINLNSEEVQTNQENNLSMEVDADYNNGNNLVL